MSGPKEIRHGIDLVEIAEFRAVFDRHPAFAERVFSDDERAYCRSRPDPAVHFAARFAAKEATLKALGIGIGAVGIDGKLKEIEVARRGGRPEVVLHGRTARAARRRGVTASALSLSHTRGMAIASVVLSTDEGEKA